ARVEKILARAPCHSCRATRASPAPFRSRRRFRTQPAAPHRV
ncbi:MAG: hypothetical protein AVDCRST_MAG89-4564, partial [uncultured Gemmatimonadetes bacterium]